MSDLQCFTPLIHHHTTHASVITTPGQAPPRSKGLARVAAKRNVLGTDPWASVARAPTSLLFDPRVAVLSTDPQGFERPGLTLEYGGGCRCTAEAVEKLLESRATGGVPRPGGMKPSLPQGASTTGGAGVNSTERGGGLQLPGYFTRILDVAVFKCWVPDAAGRKLAALQEVGTAGAG